MVGLHLSELKLTEHPKSNSSTCKHEKFVGHAHSLVLHNTFFYGVQLSKHFSHPNTSWSHCVRISEVQLYVHVFYKYMIKVLKYALHVIVLHMVWPYGITVLLPHFHCNLIHFVLHHISNIHFISCFVNCSTCNHFAIFIRKMSCFVSLLRFKKMFALKL